MKRIFKYLKPYRGQLALAMLLISLSSLCDLLLPTLMSDILDNGVREKDFSYIIQCCLKMLVVAGASLGCVLWGQQIAAKVVAGF